VGRGAARARVERKAVMRMVARMFAVEGEDLIVVFQRTSGEPLIVGKRAYTSVVQIPLASRLSHDGLVENINPNVQVIVSSP
jgi:hypothetical protein